MLNKSFNKCTLSHTKFVIDNETQITEFVKYGQQTSPLKNHIDKKCNVKCS